VTVTVGLDLGTGRAGMPCAVAVAVGCGSGVEARGAAAEDAAVGHGDDTDAASSSASGPIFEHDRTAIARAVEPQMRSAGPRPNTLNRGRRYMVDQGDTTGRQKPETWPRCAGGFNGEAPCSSRDGFDPRRSATF